VVICGDAKLTFTVLAKDHAVSVSGNSLYCFGANEATRLRQGSGVPGDLRGKKELTIVGYLGASEATMLSKRGSLRSGSQSGSIRRSARVTGLP
jgi:hypothetical protein